MPAGSDGSYDALVVGDAPPPWREHWWATAPPARAMVLAAAALVVLALVLAEVAFNSHPRHLTRTVVTAAPAGGIVDVDAAGCPRATKCSVDLSQTAAISGAIRRIFHGATVVSSVSTLDAGTGRVYRRIVVASVGRATVTVASQCIPGAQAVSRQVLQGDRTFHTLDGSTVVLARTWQVVTPGSRGCSASVGADTQTPKVNLGVAVLRLAADPSVQLA